jgi:hypothetical protein
MLIYLSHPLLKPVPNIAQAIFRIVVFIAYTRIAMRLKVCRLLRTAIE